MNTPILSRLYLASADPQLSLESLQEHARDAGIPGLHLSQAQCAEPDSELPVVSVDGLASLEHAARFGAGLTVEAGVQTAAEWDRLLPALRALTDAGRPLRVEVLLRNRYGSRIEQAIDLHRVATEDTGVKFDLDIAAFHCASVNPCDPIRGLERHIGCVRLSNVIARRQAALDRGEIDIRTVAVALRDASYHGPIVLVLGTDARAAERLIADRRFAESCDW